MVFDEFDGAATDDVFDEGGEFFLRGSEHCPFFELLDLKLALDVLFAFEVEAIFLFGLIHGSEVVLVVLVLFFEFPGSAEGGVVHHVDFGVDDEDIY